jgi:isochorismate pyruvate lyase
MDGLMHGAPLIPSKGLGMKSPLFAAVLMIVSNAGAAHADEAPAFWGTPSVDGGKCCANLAEVRTNIDRIDHEIIALMAERGRYVAEAGRFKANPAAVSAPARVEEIIAKVKTIARENGLAEDVAERAYRAMIAAFEDYEREEWGKRNAGAAK